MIGIRSVKMHNFRFVHPLVSNQLAQINERGQLVGEMTSMIMEAFIYFPVTYNITFVSVDENFKTPDAIAVGGVSLVGQDKADGAFSSLSLLMDGLTGNVTAGPVVNDGWCKLGSSPKLAMSDFSSGPELSLMQTRIEILILVILGLIVILDTTFSHQLGLCTAVWYIN